MEYRVDVQRHPAAFFVGLRTTTTAAQLPVVTRASIDRLHAHVARAGARPAGPPFARYHAWGPQRVDVEFGVPLRAPTTVGDGLHAGALRERTVAATIHAGPYAGLARAHAAVAPWMRDHGHEPAGPFEEHYVDGPGDASPRTEVARPLATVPRG